jgi:hypothetical protein
MKAKDPNGTILDFSKQCGQMWRELSDKDKKIYEDLAEADKLRYKKESLDYREKVKQAREEQINFLVNNM